MDFTISAYKKLLESLISAGYSFVTFKEYIESQAKPGCSSFVILRHDVDRLPENSLRTSLIENSLGIKGTYYFRIVPESYDEEIIREISKLGHEIGYHYEDVDLANKQLKIKNSKFLPEADQPPAKKIKNMPAIRQDFTFNEGTLIDLSYESFCKNLDRIKNIADVKTICMHGSPLSKFDNKIIWGKYNYKNLGLIGEPYLDLNWNEFGYLTDTGRKWNGEDVSVRDKVNSKYKFKFKSTIDIINNIDRLPARVMFTVHPQRWNDNMFSWVNELALQSIKNAIKKLLLVKRNT